MSEAEKTYRKFQTPDDWERKMAIIRKGCENAKKNAEKKKAFLATKQRWNHRKEVVERYGI